MYKIKFHFHRSKTVGGALIRFKTDSIFNHVSIQIDREVFEATMLHGTIVSREIRKDITDTVEIEVSQEVYMEYLDWLHTRVGNKYDVKSIFGFLFNRKKQSDSKDYCSELANRFFFFEISEYIEESKKLISPEVFYNRIKFYKEGR